MELRRSIGYVFQAIGLFPHITVEENANILIEPDRNRSDFTYVRYRGDLGKG